MILGMPSLVEFGTIYEQVRLAKKLNLQFIELNLDIPSFQSDLLSSTELRKISADEDIFFTLHLPENLDLGVFQTEIRNGNIDYLKNVIIWSEQAGINKVIMHLNKGVHFSMPDCKIHLYQQFNDLFLSNIMNGFKTINELSKKAKIPVCIENTGDFQHDFVKQALEKILQLDNMFLTRDIGHEIRSGCTYTNILDKYSFKIKHFHIHMADSKSDHMPIIELNPYISAGLNFANLSNCSIVIEVKNKDALEKSVRFIRRSCHNA